MLFTLSSTVNERSLRVKRYFNTFEVPMGFSSSTRQSATNCGRGNESRVISSLNSFENLSISSAGITTPSLLTLYVVEVEKNVYKLTIYKMT